MDPARFLSYSIIVSQPKTTWPVMIKKPLGKTLNTSIWFWCALTDRPKALMLTSWKSAESKKTKRNQSSDQSRDSTQLSLAKRPFVCLANFTNHLKTLLTNKDLNNRFIQKNSAPGYSTRFPITHGTYRACHKKGFWTFEASRVVDNIIWFD